jgi:hypothetical protein
LIKKKHIAVIRKEIFHWISRLDQEKNILPLSEKNETTALAANEH